MWKAGRLPPQGEATIRSASRARSRGTSSDAHGRVSLMRARPMRVDEPRNSPDRRRVALDGEQTAAIWAGVSEPLRIGISIERGRGLWCT